MTDLGVGEREAYEFIREMQTIKQTEDESELNLQLEYLQKSGINGAGKYAFYYAMLATDRERELMAELPETVDPAAAIEDIVNIRRAEDGTKGYARIRESKGAIGAEMALRFHSDAMYEKAVEVTTETGISFEDYFDLKFDGEADVEKGVKMLSAGINKEATMEAARALGRLEPEGDAKSVSAVQKYRAIDAADLDEKEKRQVMEVIASDSDNGRFTIATEYGISLENFVDVKENLSYLNKENTGTSGVSNAKVAAAVNNVDGLTDQQKAVLWQLFTGATTAKNNPYLGTCHEMRDNQLIAFVSLVHECYLKDESDIPLGKFSDYVAMNWDRLKDLSPRSILCDFYNNNF